MLFITPAAMAQQEILVKSGDKGLYIEHKVAPKEGLFSIGRLYSVHPKFIASYNKMDMNKGLAIGQVLRVPLTDTNFTQKSTKGTPVYYVVGDKEGLMKVSSTIHNVTLENLRNWNNLKDNVVASGDHLIVGYLVNTVPSSSIPNSTVAKTEVKAEPPKTEPAKTVTEPVKEVEKPKVEPAEPKKEIVPEQKPAVSEVTKITESARKETIAIKKDNPPVSTENGFFKYYFDQQVKQSPVRKNETVTSGIFKTTSGWLDAKYYLLLDGASPGTIVKITNPSNSKIIYAKVLGEMSGIKQNEGLNIRISSAAASALQINEEDKFVVKLNY